MKSFSENEVVGLVKPAVDAHTLGIAHLAELLRTCGYQVETGDRGVAEALDGLPWGVSTAVIRDWIAAKHVTRVGFSYRLDPAQAQEMFRHLVSLLHDQALTVSAGGPVRGVYFAGLPEACRRVQREYQGEVRVFWGDETPDETLMKLGVPSGRIPASVKAESAYDDMRMSFAQKMLSDGEEARVSSVDRSGYPEYGTERDHVLKRLAHCAKHHMPPLMRAHVGPYLADRQEAMSLFLSWVRQLRDSSVLDVLSIGTSQLTQASFGQDWGGRPNGGGVPIASEAEYRQVWEQARPMLVRTYAGTSNVPQLARVHERSLNIAWHALSFWWFCRTDGRGPNSVLKNLREHLATLDYIAESGKPFEPNIPHHFAFRGSDDVTCILSAYLAARTAKQHGVRWLILQAMLNTPRYTSGIQDLAKVRAMLRLVRELEDDTFHVILQPRAGLDYFSPDLDKARVQLAAVTAMMDDIEPENDRSPALIHVVSYTEASHLADPPAINESIRIAHAALQSYRRQRRQGKVPDLAADCRGLSERAEVLYREARDVLNVIWRTVPDPCSAEGLYRVFAAGFMPVPFLWECRDEFPAAVAWRTAIANGGVRVVGDDGVAVPALDVARRAARQLSSVTLPCNH